MFNVRKTSCPTCIYRSDLPWELEQYEHEVRNEHGGFDGFRVCHHSDSLCRPGFWNRHKDDFQVGQVAQRLKAVRFTDEEDVMAKSGSQAKREDLYAGGLCRDCEAPLLDEELEADVGAVCAGRWPRCATRRSATGHGARKRSMPCTGRASRPSRPSAPGRAPSP